MTDQQRCSDLPSVTLPDGDMLTAMMEAQKEFQVMLMSSRAPSELFTDFFPGHVFPEGTIDEATLCNLCMTEDFRTFQLKENILALHSEVTEILEWLPWKNWKNYETKYPVNKVAEARYEAIDCLHFIFNIMMLLGMSPEMVFDGFMRKQSENRARQQRGYTDESN
tara:strand:+ start:449 stop:946 length:498 start_codon:yes stop_codon:yes gene_type:complete